MKNHVLRKMLAAALMVCFVMPSALSAAAVSDGTASLSEGTPQKTLTLTDSAALADPLIREVPQLDGTSGESTGGGYYHDGNWYPEVYIVGEDRVISGDTVGGVAMADYTLVIDGDFYQTQPLVMSGGHLIIKGDLYNRYPMDINGGTVTVEGSVISSVKNTNLNGAVIDVGKDFRQTLNLTLTGAVLNVAGNYYHTDSTLTLGGGTLNIGGNYRLQSIHTDETDHVSFASTYGVLQMNDEADHMTVGGNFYTQSYYGDGSNYNDLTNGVLELKGDFYEIASDGGSGSNFNAKDNHRVTFTGEGVQTVHFEGSGSGFNILTASTNTKINLTNARISSMDSDVTVTHFTQYGNLSLNGQTLTVLENVVQKGNISGDSGAMEVKSNYTQVSGTLDLNGATITIDGDYRLQNIDTDEEGRTVYKSTYGVLQMNNETDHMTVGGSFYTQSYYGDGSNYNDLTNGVLELKGDFYEIASNGGSGSNFNAKGNHRVTFTGEGVQTVNFEGSGSGFNILTASTNTKINLTNARISSMDSDVTVTHFTQYGNLSLNGQTLTVLENVVQKGNISGDSGAMEVKSNYTQVSGTLDLNGATITIDGDYRLQYMDTDDEGNTVYKSTYGVLQMNDEADHMTVGGNFYTQSYYGDGSNYNDLTDGLLELKGDFYQLASDGGSGSNFNAKDNHRVTFTGGGIQTVNFEGSGSGFNILTASTNTKINLTNARISSMDSDVTVTHFTQYGNLSLNGQTLTVLEDVRQKGNIYGDSGTMKVNGSYTQTDGILDLNGATIAIDGDYRLQNVGEDGAGNTAYYATYGVLKMNDKADHMIVGENFYTQSYYGDGSNYNDLTNGVLELKGGFYEVASNGGSGSNFNAKGSHKVKFTGSKKQVVNFEGSSSGFNILAKSTNKNVAITNGRISKLGASATLLRFVQYGTMDVNGYTLTVTGNMTQTGNVSINKGTVNVGGTYYQTNGTLDLNGGKLTITGQYRLQSIGIDKTGKTVYGSTYGVLKMNDADDYMTVGGAFFTQSYYGDGSNYNDLTNGVLELKGNFYEIASNGGSGSNFNAKGSHQVKFTGTVKQTISFEGSGSGFGMLLAGTNENVVIAKGRIAAVGENATLAGFNQNGTLDLNGKKLIVTGDFVQNGNVNVNGGRLVIRKNYTQTGGTLDLNGGRLEVSKDYRLQTVSTDEEGNTTYKSTYGVLKMNDPTDYLLVKGSFYTQSYYGDGANYNDLTNGIFELRGNFYQISSNGGSGSNFNAKGRHLTLLTGTQPTTIIFQSPKYSGFNYVVFANFAKEQYIVDDTLVRLYGYADEYTLLNYSTLAADRVVTGSSFVVNTRSFGGSGSYRYAVYYKSKTTQDYQLLQDFVPADKLTLKLTPVDEYDILIRSMDTDGRTADRYETLTVAKPLENNSSLAADKVRLGENIVVRCAADGGSGEYQYEVSIRNTKDSAFTLVRDYNSGDTVTIKTAAEGTFEVMVRVKDTFGKIIKKKYTVTVDNKLVNTSVISAGSIRLGETVTLTASAQGGSGSYTYAAYYKKATATAWSTIRSYGESPDFTFKPAAAVTYDVCVKVKDTTGKIEKLYFTITVTAELTNQSTVSAASVTLGETVTLKGAAKYGTAPYTYAYFYKKASSSTWTTLKSFSTKTAVTLKPAAAVKYDILIKIKDSTDTIVEKAFTLSVTK